MRILKYEQSLGNLTHEQDPVIFLAGPTVRGNQPHLTSWRVAAAEEFKRQGFDGILVVPEFSVATESDKGKLWIPRWEFAGLSASDVNLFWIPRTKELIGLTTNHEHGYWLAQKPEKLVYGRPDDAYRCAYLDIMWEVHALQHKKTVQPVHTTLKATVESAIELATASKFIHRAKSELPVDSPYGAF